MKTRASAFANLVDYRTYRLLIRNKAMTVGESTEIYHVMQQVDALSPMIEVLDGRGPIGLLSWLSMLCDTFEMLGTFEESVVHVIAYSLGGEAKEVQAEQFGMVELDFADDQAMLSEHGSWPHVVHALIRRFLTDDGLREAHDAVSRAEQKTGEDEIEFADMVCNASRQIRQVFTKRELINSFVQGLSKFVRELVSQKVRKMTEEDR